MRAKAPWSVKGIEAEARDTAKTAARKSGVTVGEWLNNVIMESGASPEDGKGGDKLRAGPHADMHARLEDLSQELAELARQNAASKSEGVKSDCGKSEDDLTAALRELASRVENSERQTSEILSEFKDELYLMARGITPDGSRLEQPGTEAATTPPPMMPAPPPAVTGPGNGELKNLEKALELVVSHIEMTDKRNAEVLKSVQSRLSDLNARITALPSSAKKGNVDQLRQLEQRVSQLASRLGEQSAGDNARLYKELESRISHLANDVNATVEKKVAQFSERMEHVRPVHEDPAVLALKNDIRRLENQVSQATEHFENDQRFQPLHDRIASLTQSLEQIRSSAAPVEQVAELDGKIGSMAARLDMTESSLSGLDRVETLEDKLSKLAARLDASLENANPHPQIADLDERVSTLAVQFENALQNTGSADALARIEQQYDRLTERLEGAENRFKDLDRFEERIGQLFKAMDQSRTAAIEAAEKTAEQAAEKAAGQAIEQFAASQEETLKELARDAADQAAEKMSRTMKPQASTGMDEFYSAFQNIEQSVEDVRTNSDLIEKRTQDTLQAVHDSLETIVERLTSLEAQTASPAAPADPWQDTAAAPSEAPEDLRLPPLDPPLPETGNPAGESHEPASGLEQIYGSASHEPAFGSFPDNAYARDGETEQPSEPNDDFIASARRAAQAATRTALGDTESLSQGLEGAEAPSGLGGWIRNNGRPLIVAGSVTLVIVGIVSWLGLGGGDFPDGMAGLEMNPPVAGTPKAVPSADVTPPPPAAAQPVQTNSIPPAMPVAPAGNGGEKLVAPARSTAVSPVAEKPAGGSSVIAKTTAPAPAAQPSPLDNLRMAADAGNAAAQYDLANRYRLGKGVTKNLKKAVSLYRKAAAQGLAMAQYRLGTHYEKGLGIARDRAKARIWYRRAADQGNRKAMHNLAVIYAEGGISSKKPDFRKAAIWFRKAAERGLTDSQFNLAILSERGLGVKQNLAEAYKWFSLAAGHGDKDAGNRAEAIANRMTSAQLAAAKKRVSNWRPKPMKMAANQVEIPAGGWGAVVSADRAVTTSRRTMLMNAQRLLADLGYKPGPADGQMGARTRQAIIRFQKNAGLNATGQVSQELLDRLQAARG